MNLNNISFPYPVLGSYDDIYPAPNPAQIVVEEDNDNYYFDINLSYDNKEIEDYVHKDYADYACEIVCESTFYRKCFKGKELSFKIAVPRRSVSGRIDIICTIVLKKGIDRYVNKGFHPDYAGHEFRLEPGDLLGILDISKYNADIKYDKLKAVGTFMEIVETDDSLPSTILNKPKIEIRLPHTLYKQYLDCPSVNNRPQILHASIVQNSLIYALCNIEQHESCKWAETIMYRVKNEPELEEFRNIEPDEWEVDKLSQILLGNPYERMFNYLIESDKTIE